MTMKDENGVASEREVVHAPPAGWRGAQDRAAKGGDLCIPVRPVQGQLPPRGRADADRRYPGQSPMALLAPRSLQGTARDLLCISPQLLISNSPTIIPTGRPPTSLA